MILALLSTLFGSIFSGGMTGIAGVAIQRYFDEKNKRLDMEASKDRMAHEINLKRVDAEIMAQEWAARTQVAEIEAAGRSDVADAQAFAASFNEPQRYVEGSKLSRGQTWVMVWLDFIRGMVRPTLTVYLCGITTLVYFQCNDQLGAYPKVVTSDQVLELMKLVIGTILYLTTTCVLWWFGTRNKGKPPSKSK